MFDWLDYAKQANSGGRPVRFGHCGNSGRNAVAYNNPRGYSAKCYSCGWKDYKAKKLYISKGAAGEDHKPGVRVSPVPLDKLIPELTREVWKYTLKYGMTPIQAGITGVYKDRIIFECGDVQKGRLMPFLDNSVGKPKWVTYMDGVAMLGSGSTMVAVEDIVSMHKVYSTLPKITIICLLGTSFKSLYRTHLEGIEEICWFLDGDGAGARGIVNGLRELAPWVTRQSTIILPTGNDPKDLHMKQIQELFHDRQYITSVYETTRHVLPFAR